MPLLFFSGLALEQHGWPVEAVSWELPGDMLPADPSGWVAGHARAAMASAPADTWIVAAKSLGTRVVDAGLPFAGYVLLTPLLTEPAQVSAISARARAVDRFLTHLG